MYFLQLAVDYVVLAWGVSSTLYGAYRLSTQQRGHSEVMWLIAGMATIGVILIDHTVLIDAANNGEVRFAAFMKDFTDGILIFLWAYVAYIEGFLGR